MKLKSLFIFLCVVVSFTMQSINAATVYCPTQIICDKSNCKINGDNGGSWKIQGSDKPGVYGFWGAQNNQGNPQDSAIPLCIYNGLNDYMSVIFVTGEQNYYVAGPNWKWKLAWQVCPGGETGPYVFTLPQACPFSTAPPAKKQIS